MHTRTPTPLPFHQRAACLLASLLVTALLLSSQLGLAGAYTQQADSLLAARSLQQPKAQQIAPSKSPRAQV